MQCRGHLASGCHQSTVLSQQPDIQSQLHPQSPSPAAVTVPLAGGESLPQGGQHRWGPLVLP